MSERHRLPMVCTCGEERKAAADARYEKAKARLSQGSSETRAFEVTDRNFVDCLIWSLMLDHNATVQEIPGDQWFGVGVEFFKDDYKSPEKVYVECDSPTDGLVAIWEWLEARHDSG